MRISDLQESVVYKGMLPNGNRYTININPSRNEFVGLMYDQPRFRERIYCRRYKA